LDVNSDIITLDAITGSQMAVLSGHTGWVRSVTFSSDGRSLASGSDDRTVKLWDMQTGGVVKTFHGHNIMFIQFPFLEIALGLFQDLQRCTICLWDIQTGECLHSQMP
jgi:WD40 repeat protein